MVILPINYRILKDREVPEGNRREGNRNLHCSLQERECAALTKTIVLGVCYYNPQKSFERH